MLSEVIEFLRSNFSVIIGVLGTAATLILGIWALYLALRHRYRNRISFINESCIGLFDSIVRNFEELEVLYEKEPVSESLVLLKGALINTGADDITPDMVDREGELRIILPENYRWRRAKIIYASSKAAEVRATGLEMTFKLGVFKRNESIRFWALAEVPTQPNSIDNAAEILDKKLDFAHHIAHTQNIERRTFQTTPIYHYILLLLSMGAIFLLFMFTVTIFMKRNDGVIRYSWVIDDSKTVDVKVTPKINGTVELEGIGEDFTSVLPADIFFQEHEKFKQRIIKPLEESFKFFLWVYGICAVLIFATIMSFFMRRRSTNRIINLLYGQKSAI